MLVSSDPVLRLHEKVKALFQYVPIVLFSNFMIAGLLLVVLWNQPAISTAYLVNWGLAMVGMIVFRAICLGIYQKWPPSEKYAVIWGYVATFGSGLAGILWGGTAFFLLLTPEIDYQLMGMLVLATAGAGAISLLTPYLPAFFAYFVPSLLPFVLVLVWRISAVSLLLAALILLYMIILSLFARKIHAGFVNSLDLKYDNINLMAELRLQTDEAVRSNIAKSRFLAAASHDLRQPMHALGLFVETLKERILYPDLRKIVDNIGNSVEAMNDLFNALLDISKLDAGVIQPIKTDFDILNLLERIHVEFEKQIRDSGLRMSVRTKSAIVYSDAALLERILRNFMTNALRYTKKGGIVIRVRERDTMWCIEVLDSGLGIPDNHLKDIFQEFVQLDNPERDRSKGLGLGLAIVDRLAHLLGHPISVKSKVGRGSVFGIKVPKGDASKVQVRKKEVNEAAFTGFAGVLIIVVDDEAAILEGMRSLLQGWGCDVITAGSGGDMQSALAACDRVPDLIISDYRLRQGETGVQVITRLQQEFNEMIPAVLITGDTAPDRLQEARASGFEIMHKPLQPAKLRALLSHLLRKRLEG